MTRIPPCVALAFLVFAASTAAQDDPQRSIALTFDDAPLGDGPFMTGTERTDALIAALDDADVEGAMFFVTTKHLDREGGIGINRLRRYVTAGHRLGNHSHAHLWLHRVSVDEYVADLDVASGKLAAFDGVTPYFRFPYLDEGRDVAKRDALRAALAKRELMNGYVTIDDYDWYMVSLAADAIEAGQEPDMDALRDAYVELLADAVEFYDGVAQQVLGRSPKHVLLLHENDLAAMFVDDLVVALRSAGWRIIPAIDAFTDPIAAYEPETLFLGQGRIAAIAHEAGFEARDLVHLTEDEDALRAEFIRRGLLPAD